MARLPIPGADNGTWGDVLNAYLAQAHNADGTLKSGVVGAGQIQDGVIPTTKLDASTQSAISKANSALQSAPVTSVVGQTGAVTGTQIAADTAVSGTYVHWDGANLTQSGSSIPVVSGSGGGTYLFSAQTASIVASAAISITTAITIGQCRLSCTGAPAGSNLIVVLQSSTNGGTTWSDVQSLTIVAGSTTAQTATPSAAIASGALIRVNCTSAGSGTAAVGVLYQANYT